MPRLKQILAIFLFSTLAAAQDPTARLTAAAKLWARIHYTHPWLAAKDIDWDRSFAEAAPKILAAQSKEEYRAAVSGMLAALGDPATYVATPPDESRLTPREPSFRREQDIVVLDPGIGGPAPFLKMVPELLTELAKKDVRVLVVDARNSPSFIQRWSDTITAHSAPGLVSVGRSWSGYPNPQSAGNAYNGYRHSLSSTAGAKVTGAPEGTAKPIVVVANSWTSTPPGLIALQIAGRVAFVLEGEHSYDAVVPQSPMPLGEGLVAAIRNVEFTHADGSHGFVPQRDVEKDGLGAALELARAGAISPVSTRPRGFQLRPFAEKSYADQPYPSEGLRMLSALRVWSVFENFFPYKHLIGEDWGAVLPSALEDARAAKDSVAYHQAIARLVARTNDTHCFVGSRVLSEHWGSASLPFLLRWVEGRPVVIAVTKDGAAAGVRPGDVVIALDGRSFLERLEERKPLVAASTPQSKIARAMYSVTLGAEGSTSLLTLEGENGVRRDLEVKRAADYQAVREKGSPVYRKLDDRTGYVDLERLTEAQVGDMFDEFKNSKAIILDMRGYPRGTAWSIAPRLSAADQPVNAEFRRNLLNMGNAETMLFEQRLPARGKSPRYEGRTVMLIDERAISQSEHSGLMYKTANGTQFVGEPTTGANPTFAVGRI